MIDGDTIQIETTIIRFLDIDAPEQDQVCYLPDDTPWPCGKEATAALKDLLMGLRVTCASDRRDRYGRYLALCTARNKVDDKDFAIGLWLAARGWVVPYRDCTCETVRKATFIAAMTKVGVWRGHFDWPWEWRKAH